MVRGRSKICLPAAFVMLMLCVLSVTAFAETKTAEIFKLENASNMALTLYYDVEEPDVTIISPSGKALTANDYTVQRGDKAVCYYIPNASAGQWSMEYDKKNNQKLDVNWAPYANSLSVEKLSFTAETDYLDAVFQVTSNSDGNFNYALYAAVLNENGEVSGKRELSTGTAKIAVENSIKVYTDKLQPYDKYYLYLEVWRSEYGLEASSNAVSDASFSVSGDNLRPAIENVDVQVKFTESTVLIDWKNYAVNCDEYIIGVFNTANDSEPIYANSFKNNIYQTEISFSQDISDIRIELSYVYNENVSATLKKEVPIKTGVEFDLPSEEVTSSKQVMISYTAASKTAAAVKVNENKQDISIEGNGSFSINLEDFDNEIEIKYSLNDEKVVYIHTYQITIDTAAPVLLLPENDVTLYVESETFNLAGATEADSILTINDTLVSVNADGTFIQTLTLTDGENEFLVKAADKAGNVTSQLIVINKVKSAANVGNVGNKNNGSGFKFLPMILAFIGSAVLVAAAIILNILYRKNRACSAGYAAVCLIRNIAFIAAVLSLLALGYVVFEYFRLDGIVNSEKLFEISDNSVNDAYEIISRHDLFGKFMIIGIITAGSAIVIFVAALLIAKRLKLRASNTNEAPAPKEKKKRTGKSAKASAQAPEQAQNQTPVQPQNEAPQPETPGQGSTGAQPPVQPQEVSQPETSAQSLAEAQPPVQPQNETPKPETSAQSPAEAQPSVQPQNNDVTAQPPTTGAAPKKCYCPYCGTQNEISSVFCRECGKKIK